MILVMFFNMLAVVMMYDWFRVPLSPSHLLVCLFEINAMYWFVVLVLLLTYGVVGYPLIWIRSCLVIASYVGLF